MKPKMIFSFLLFLLVTTCVSPLAVLSKGDKALQTDPVSKLATPVSKSATSVNYIPLVMLNPGFISTPTPTSTPTPIPTSTSIPPGSGGSIADHTVLSMFSSIPEDDVKAASALKTLFIHASTGDHIQSMGLNCLQGTLDDPGQTPPECNTYSPYYYDRSNWNWPLWDPPTDGAFRKTDQFVSWVNAQQQNYQVLGMKLCYEDEYDHDYFDYYREKMELLESTYPEKTFIWTTQALWATSLLGGSTGVDIQNFNQQLRAYARANNKFLYDIADIESHDLNGNFCQVSGIEGLCEVYFTGYGGGGGGHPNYAGSIRLAKGFWWLMARISGWNGN